MKQIFVLALLLSAVGAGFAQAAAGETADPCEGFWISIDDKTGKATAGWYIYTADGTLFGKIRSLAGFPQDVRADKCKSNYPGFPVAGNVRTMSVVGTPWIYGLKPEARGVWSGGSLIDPNNGNLYKCKITYYATHPKDKSRGETLEMRGEIGMGVGRSQFWRRASEEEAAGLR
jgi:uncharacterized protein (DUF2147 family)